MKTMNTEQREDGVVIARINTPNASANTFGQDFYAELRGMLDRVEEDDSIRGILFTSAKDDFCLGADIMQLERQPRAAALEGLSRRVQELMNRVATLGVPTGCAIHGKCLGAGLELALACDYRFASQHRDTAFGQPEVKLGILPGAGGTQRLPRLIGLEEALPILLTGKPVDAEKARAIGLVDALCPQPLLIRIAAKRMLADNGSSKSTRGGITDWLRRVIVDELAPARRLMLDEAEKRAHEKGRGNYPAPARIIDVVKTGLERGFSDGLAAEAKAFGELGASKVARELIRLFLLRRRVKRARWFTQASAQRVQRVGVVGAGLMGAGIAFVTAADADHPVRLVDKDMSSLAGGLRALDEAAERRVAGGRMSDLARRRLMHRVGPTLDLGALEHCDVVIEAVYEDVGIKRKILSAVEDACSEEVIFATNTSAIPLADIAHDCARPERVVGMHYFSPVADMPLCEIVQGTQTSPDVLRTCVELAKRQGKLVIVVRDGPGFYTTRILTAYLAEALGCLARGSRIDTIDRALENFGFPMGPFRLVDEVGVDVAFSIAQVMRDALADRFAVPVILEHMVTTERLGKKNGSGFYGYDNGSRGEPETALYELLPALNDDVAEEDIAWRCVLRMLDEAVRCYEDGVIRSTQDGDAGAVFGLGFPPFLGGPFRVIATRGAKVLVDKARQFELPVGDLFAEMAKNRGSSSEAFASVLGH